MKLTYRGVSYDYTPNSVPKKGPAIDTGMYRGSTVTFNTLAEQPVQPSANLVWRGVPFQSVTPKQEMAPVSEPVVAGTVVAEEDLTVAQANYSVVALSRNLFVRHHQRMRRREQGMMVRLASEIGISVKNAGRYESHIQGKMPHNFSGYNRSAAAMS